MGRLNRAGRKKTRNFNSREVAPARYLIITEGTVTEVNYFQGIKRIIDNRYKDRIKVESSQLVLDIKGLGRGTTKLVNYAIQRRSQENYSEVWVVFDKDNFEDFDEAIKLAHSEDINVAWSNTCFELWILLHFQDFGSPLMASKYSDKLDVHFRNLKYNGGKYEKDIKNIFELIKNNTSEAIKRSNRLLDNYKCDDIETFSKINPGTTVQNLVGELLPYID